METFQYLPIVRLRADKADIIQYAKCDEISSIELFEDEPLTTY